MGVERLAASLTRLQDALAEVRLPLDIPGAAEQREVIRTQIDQIEDYVLPRLRRLDAPLLTVVGGSTGAGKSTLVNSLIGRAVSQSGVIRPTTRSSVLVHHPDDARWFSSGLILPGLARSETSVVDPRVLQLVPEESMPRGLAILDAPDVDSIVAANRTLAAQLLAAADLWLFVTSAARYADAVPWQYLRAAARRRAVVAVVLDRVPPAAMEDVPPHLGQMMSQRGLGASPLFAIPETEVDQAGLLPDAAVAPIRGWLADLAEDTVRRNEVVLQTLDGAIQSLATSTPEIVQAVAEQNEAVETLRGDAEKSFAEAVRSVAAQTADGTLLRGEVLARWQDFVGTGEFFRAVEKRIGLFRDRLVQVAKGEPKQAQDLQLAVESGLEVLIREEGEFAARRVVSAWEAHPAGRQLLARDDALGKVSLDFSEASARVIRQWQGDVLELVGNEGKSKKAMARYLALGVNGAGVALMIFVFSQTGGLVGAEVGVAGGTALLAQRVLEAVFGEDAVRRLAKEAKLQLDARVEGLMATELARFEKLVDEIETRIEHGEQLSAALNGLQIERTDEARYEREVVGAPTLPVPPSAGEVAALAPVAEVSAEVDTAETDAAETDATKTDATGGELGEEAEEELIEDSGDPESSEQKSGGETPDEEPTDDAVTSEVSPDAAAPEVLQAEAQPDPNSNPDAAGEQAASEVPQRFVAGDTGLLPSLVSAQLSALAQDASRRGEDDEWTDGDPDAPADAAEPGGEDGVDAPVEEADGETAADADADADADTGAAGAAVEEEVESVVEPPVEETAADADGEDAEPGVEDAAEPAAVHDKGDGSEDVVAPDADADAASEVPAVRSDPIPVPSGLAALVAEAVRRPEDDSDDAAETISADACDEDNEESFGDAPVDDAPADAEPAAVDQPEDGSAGQDSTPEVESADSTDETGDRPSDAAQAPTPVPAFVLPAAPPLMMAPVVTPEAPAPEVGPGVGSEPVTEPVEDPTPEVVALPALVPPDSIPPAPPVPAWPLPEPPVVEPFEGE